MIGENSPPGEYSPPKGGRQQFDQASCPASSCLNQALNQAPEGANSLRRVNKGRTFPKQTRISPAERDRINEKRLCCEAGTIGKTQIFSGDAIASRNGHPYLSEDARFFLQLFYSRGLLSGIQMSPSLDPD